MDNFSGIYSRQSEWSAASHLRPSAARWLADEAAQSQRLGTRTAPGSRPPRVRTLGPAAGVGPKPRVSRPHRPPRQRFRERDIFLITRRLRERLEKTVCRASRAEKGCSKPNHLNIFSSRMARSRTHRPAQGKR
ncbi:unnamed protein product [Ixodes pacificus]